MSTNLGRATRGGRRVSTSFWARFARACRETGGEYHIEHGEPGSEETIRVGPGEFFLSRAGTPYTMTAGPEGVTYIETWPQSVTELETVWHDVGWVHR